MAKLLIPSFIIYLGLHFGDPGGIVFPSVMLAIVLVWGFFGIQMLSRAFARNTCHLCGEKCKGSYCSKACEEMWCNIAKDSYRQNSLEEMK